MIWRATGKFFVACLAGTTLASIAMSFILPGRRMSPDLLLAGIFGLPIEVFGLLPIALVISLMRRWSKLHPLLLISVALLAGWFLGSWMSSMFGGKWLGGIYGVSVAGCWAILTFFSDLTQRANARDAKGLLNA